MPILVTPPMNGLERAACDYATPENNPLQEIQLDASLHPLKDAAARFEEKTNRSIPEEEARGLVKYSNFLSVRVLELINQSGCTFIRVFNAVHEGGFHFTFMVPLDANGDPIKLEATIYLVQCCACPPMCKPGVGGL